VNALRAVFGLALIFGGFAEGLKGPMGRTLMCFGVYVISHAFAIEARGR